MSDSANGHPDGTTPNANTTQVNTPPSSAAAPAVMRPLNSLLEKWTPSALMFAIVLSVVVGILALVLTPTKPVDVLVGWGDGLSGLLEFMTQMALIIFLGHMLAHTQPVRKLLAKIADVPSGPRSAYVLVFVVAGMSALITWGLSLVVGALLAVEVARSARRRGFKVHFPLLVAAGYSGMVVWHMGYSASGPLTAATPGSFLDEAMGGTIPVSQTIFAWWNLAAAALVLIVMAILFALTAPKPSAPIVEMPAEVEHGERPFVGEEVVTPADRIDASRIPTLLVGLLLAAYIVVHFARGGTMTLDIVNWSFLTLILLLVRSPFEIIYLAKGAAVNVGEILLQFPLYAGIMGIMSASGLIEIFSNALVSISGPHTFGVLAFLAAGVVNFFVPSGGGQFAVQGPIMLKAAESLGIDPSIAIMAVSYGDQWTNMIQPFWALPVLAIAGLKMRDILGYTTMTLVGSGIVLGGTLFAVSFLA